MPINEQLPSPQRLAIGSAGLAVESGDIVLRSLRACLTSDRQFDVDARTYKELVYLVGPDGLAKFVSQLIVKDKLPFPFKRFFMNETISLEERFNNLKQYKAPVGHDAPKIPFTKVVSRLKDFWERFPVKYNGEYVVLSADDDMYESIDILSDYFMEEPRVRSVGYGEQRSPFDHWQDGSLHNRWLPTLFLNPTQRVLTARALREWLYARSQPRLVEARQGKPSIYMSLFQLLRPRRILDVASAWGDRLLAAMAYGAEMYVGVDANPDLRAGYDQMLEKFAPGDAQSRYRMIISPSESADLPKDVLYDLILMSPAPYRTEMYSNPQGQASNYASYEEWMVKYFFATLRVMWNHLEDGGSVAITILDRTDKGNTLHYVEAVQLYLQYKMRGAVFDGIIWWSGSGADVPFWMWRKDLREHCEKRRLEAKVLFKKFYGPLYWEVVRQTQAGDRKQADDKRPRSPERAAKGPYPRSTEEPPRCKRA